MTHDLDGRIGEGWSGEAPNGSHVNVVLAGRGSPTWAAAISMFAHPAPGHTPVLVCVGPTQQEYEPVWPPTLMMNKATALDDRSQTMTWGAASTMGELSASASYASTTAGRAPTCVSHRARSSDRVVPVMSWPAAMRIGTS